MRTRVGIYKPVAYAQAVPEEQTGAGDGSLTSPSPPHSRQPAPRSPTWNPEEAQPVGRSQQAARRCVAEAVARVSDDEIRAVGNSSGGISEPHRCIFDPRPGGTGMAPVNILSCRSASGPLPPPYPSGTNSAAYEKGEIGVFICCVFICCEGGEGPSSVPGLQAAVWQIESDCIVDEQESCEVITGSESDFSGVVL